jgi:carbonic anhydrase
MGGGLFTIRRRFLYCGAVLAGGVIAGAGFLGGVAVGRRGAPPGDDPRPADPAAAWAALLRGNGRWVSGTARHPHQDPVHRRAVATTQSPYAVVLSCIDSRVPPEVVFDTGVGDLMVVRTAAHTLDPLVTAAVEYGPQDLGAPLIVVLGHQRCGAVTAAARALAAGERLPGQLEHIVTALKPVYESVQGAPDLVAAMVRANTLAVARRVAADPLLAPRIGAGRLRVVAAHYSLDTGRVTEVGGGGARALTRG